MSFFSWLRTHHSNRALRGRPRHRRTAPRFRPQLEALEARDVPSTLTVTNNLDSGSGSLRAEIATAQSGDTIVFAPSLDGQTITLTSGELLITKGLTIQGPGAGQLAISGGGTSRVFEVNASQPVVLSGLNIAHGSEGLDGGAIFNNTALTISNCNIFSSRAEFGGGIWNGGTLAVNDSEVGGDIATLGGGGINNEGTLTLSNSTFDNDRSDNGDGGGIWNGGKLTASGCTVYNNVAGGSGGGLYNLRTATLTNCTLSGNKAYASSSASPGGGGGIYVYGGPITLINCTLSLNSAPYASGGGIDVNPGGILNLINTIVAGNTGPGGFASDINGAVATADHNLVGNGAGSTGIVNGSNGNIVGANADLGPLQDNGGPTWTMALRPKSPAIGHADNSAAPSTDQRGVVRLDKPGETTDIGAFEL
jgi:hypothetical protein